MDGAGWDPDRTQVFSANFKLPAPLLGQNFTSSGSRPVRIRFDLNRTMRGHVGCWFEVKTRVPNSRRRVSMNIKLASVMLFCSFAISCNTSEGQLLDRMLSKVGCSMCQTASACDTGCNTGCGSNGLLYGGCGNETVLDGCGTGGPGILAKIKDRLSSVGCGCQSAPVSDCGCVEPVVESCGCDAAPFCGSPGILDKIKARLSTIGAGDCGCGAPVADCGCSAPAPVMNDCGCGTAPALGGGGLLEKFRVSMPAFTGDCGCAPVSDCGPVAPIVEPCGCGPTSMLGGRGLLTSLRGRLPSMGGDCGCGAPVADCGCSGPALDLVPVNACDTAPACGCSGGKIRGMFSNVGGRVRGMLPTASADCGCAAPAPMALATSSCGCADASPCDGGTARLTLLDRLRGNRIARDRGGRVIGGGCNDGCNPPCPTGGCGGVAAAPAVAAPCGCGSSIMYNEVPMNAAPMGTPVYSEGTIMNSTPAVETAVPATEGVIEEAPEVNANPVVDPNAFIIRGGRTNG